MPSYYSISAIIFLLSFAYNTYAISGIGIITTIAGTGNAGFSGDDSIATSADLNNPRGVHVDETGNVYIADSRNCRVRKVDTNGVIITIAGVEGNCVGNNYNGDNIAATSASLSYPRGVTTDTLGNIYIADQYNNRVRKVDLNGVITTIAGTGIYGFNGDNITAANADLKFPSMISVDQAGSIYIADVGNNRIRKVDANRIITTFAGSGGFGGYGGDNGLATDASIQYPSGVSSDSLGNIYIADSNRIRKVDINGIITTVAGGGNGGDGGAAINSSTTPYGIFSDSFGNFYIADAYNQRIRKVDINGIINTVAGTGDLGYNGDNIAATDAQLFNPYGVTTDTKGNLYIADTYNNRIRKVTFPNPPTAMPTVEPTRQPSTPKPTKKTTSTKTPSFRPTNKPSRKKTASPFIFPSATKPTKKPTKKPRKKPTK